VLNEDDDVTAAGTHSAPPSAQKKRAIAPFWRYLEMAYKLRDDFEIDEHVFLKVTVDGDKTISRWKAEAPKRNSGFMRLRRRRAAPAGLGVPVRRELPQPAHLQHVRQHQPQGDQLLDAAGRGGVPRHARHGGGGLPQLEAGRSLKAPGFNT
jgi:hypothetical protein